MLKPALITVAVLSVAAFGAAVIFCSANGVALIGDLRNFRMMRAVDAPVVVALANGSLVEGSTVSQLLSTQQPEWTEEYGCFVTYGFTPVGSYDHYLVSAVDGRLVDAQVGSCTWRWTFFRNVPDDVAAAVGAVDGLRQSIDRMPERATVLQPLLDAELAKLTVASGATAVGATASPMAEPLAGAVSDGTSSPLDP